MAKKDKKAAKDADKNERVIADNRKARHNYHRARHARMRHRAGGQRSEEPPQPAALARRGLRPRRQATKSGSSARTSPSTPTRTRSTTSPSGRRKLLMHRREIKKFAGQAFEKGLTLVPLKMYFKEGRAKVLLGICRGKQKHDKRESMKKRDAQRDIDRAMRSENETRQDDRIAGSTG